MRITKIFKRLVSIPALFYLKHRVSKSVKALRQCDKVICNSQFTYNVTKRVVPEDKLVVVHNMIDYEKLQNIKPYDFGQPTILYLNKANKNKGAHVFIQAMKRLPRTRSMLVSEPSQERDAMQMLAKQEGVNVEFIDYVPNDTALAMIKGCAVFVIPALWHEPLGRTHLEGLGLGARIVTTMTGGTGDIIENEVNGLIFDGTPQHLAEQIKRLLKDSGLCRRLSRNAEKTAREKFDQSVILPQVLNVYEDVLEKQPKELIFGMDGVYDEG